MTTPIKYTFRLWRKNVAVTFIAVMAMAFGVGLVSTQFSFLTGCHRRHSEVRQCGLAERKPPRQKPSAVAFGLGGGDRRRERNARLGVEPASRFPRIYFAHPQQAWERMVVLVQTRQSSASQAFAIRRIVNRLAPDLAVERVESLSDSLTEALRIPRLINAIFLGAGAAAIFLAALGIFGVVSFSVSLRKRDFAIRMALGAQRRRIFALVLRRSLIHLLPGLGLGSALAFALGKPLASELIGVAAFDPQISFLVAGCVTIVALIAIILPARRATEVDPMVALRCE